jgi:hypothetical protein
MERQKLREYNFMENLQREKKKQQFKKMVILEKEKKYTDKINAIKTEKQIIDKCKSEVNNNHLKTKELKMTAIFKLNGKSVLDKSEKLKTKQLA